MKQLLLYTVLFLTTYIKTAEIEIKNKSTIQYTVYFTNIAQHQDHRTIKPGTTVTLLLLPFIQAPRQHLLFTNRNTQEQQTIKLTDISAKSFVIKNIITIACPNGYKKPYAIFGSTDSSFDSDSVSSDD